MYTCSQGFNQQVIVTPVCHHEFTSILQISMNATQTMEAVNRSVATHQDLESVAAGLGLWWRAMASPVEVSL